MLPISIVSFFARLIVSPSLDGILYSTWLSPSLTPISKYISPFDILHNLHILNVIPAGLTSWRRLGVFYRTLILRAAAAGKS